MHGYLVILLCLPENIGFTSFTFRKEEFRLRKKNGKDKVTCEGGIMKVTKYIHSIFFAFYYTFCTIVFSYFKIVLSKRKQISRWIMEIPFSNDIIVPLFLSHVPLQKSEPWHLNHNVSLILKISIFKTFKQFLAQSWLHKM